MRRLRSTSEDLLQMIERDISARDIAQPLSSFDDGADASSVKNYLLDRGFDEIGVRVDGIVVGYAVLDELDNAVLSEKIHAFEERDVIDSSVPLHEVFSILEIHSRVYVEVLGEVGGIITRADMHKIPVRMWLFGLISIIEMQMLRVIREYYPGASWKGNLSSGRLDLANDVFNDRKRRNEETDLADCLQFCDKRDLLIKNVEIMNDLGSYSKGSIEDLLKELEILRNELAHSQDYIAGKWPSIPSLVQRGMKLLYELENLNAS